MKKLERGERHQALFFLGAGILLVIGVVTAFVGLPFGDNKVEYTLQFTDSIIGIDEGSPVRYKGVRFGSIRRIVVDPTNSEWITVTLAVDPDTPITESTQARIASATFLGPYYIELLGTRPGSPKLPPGSAIPADPSTLSKILKSSESLVANIDNLVLKLNEFLTPDRQAKLWDAIDNFNDTLARASENFDTITSKATGMMTAFQDLGERGSRILERREQSILRIVDNFDRISGHLDEYLQSGRLEEISDGISKTLKQFNDELAAGGAAMRKYLADNNIRPALEEAVAELAAMQASVSALADIAQTELQDLGQNGLGPLATDLRATSATLDGLLRMLRHNPRALLFGEKPQEIAVPEPSK